MEVVETLIKMMWWYGRGLPPRRLGVVVYDWGGFSAAAPGQMRLVPADVSQAVADVAQHASTQSNVFAVAWLWSKSPPTLWRLLPTPVPKRRILYFADWNKTYVSEGEVLAVKWVLTDCCYALAWSYPWTWIVSRRVLRSPLPTPPARARL
ncbi:MAG: hypothetical protein ACO2PN_24955 [Pyrobaculum sp.]|jgi:hypothetical protein